MSFSLPPLAGAPSMVSFRDALGGAISHTRATIRRWLPFALLATLGDLIVTSMTGGGIGIGGFLFSVWFLHDILLRAGRIEGDFRGRLLSALGSQLLAALATVTAALPAGVGYLLLSSIINPSLIDDGVPLDPSVFSDPRFAAGVVVGIVGLLIGLYTSLRLSLSLLAAITGDTPLMALRRSISITRGAFLTVLSWTAATSLLGSGAVTIGALIGSAGGVNGALIGSLAGNLLFSPVAHCISLTLFERLSLRAAPR